MNIQTLHIIGKIVLAALSNDAQKNKIIRDNNQFVGRICIDNIFEVKTWVNNFEAPEVWHGINQADFYGKYLQNAIEDLKIQINKLIEESKKVKFLTLPKQPPFLSTHMQDLESGICLRFTIGTEFGSENKVLVIDGALIRMVDNP